MSYAVDDPAVAVEEAAAALLGDFVGAVCGDFDHPVAEVFVDSAAEAGDPAAAVVDNPAAAVGDPVAAAVSVFVFVAVGNDSAVEAAVEVDAGQQALALLLEIPSSEAFCLCSPLKKVFYGHSCSSFLGTRPGWDIAA